MKSHRYYTDIIGSYAKKHIVILQKINKYKNEHRIIVITT